MSNRIGVSALFPIAIAFLASLATVFAVETDSLLDTAKDLTGTWNNWLVNRKDGWYKSNSGLASGMVYSVCQVESDEALEFWLRSPFIDCRDARSVSVELRFTTRSCAKHPRPDGLKRCKETLDLMVLHSAGSAADASLAANLSDTFFTKAHTVAPDVKWEKNPKPGQMHKIINTKVFTFEVQRKGLYIALRDTGSCVSLVQVRVYFMACPQTVANLTVFDRTPAPHHSAADLRAVDLRTVRGRCVEGGELRGGPAPSRICRFNGQWFDLHNSGHCVCSAGRFAQAGTSCDPCPPNSYKPLAGAGVCTKCPDNSQAEAQGSKSCACRPGFYRNALLDSPHHACTKPPSAPRDAIVTENSRSRIVLSWSPPEDTGGRADIRYHVDCYGCGPAGIRFEPGPSVTERSVIVRGLQPLTRYTFHVYALNGVSEMAGTERRAWRAVTVQTSASLPSKLDAVSARIINLTSVQLSWQRTDPSIEEFELKVFPKKDHSRPLFHFTNKEQYLLENLDSRQTYLVQIRARTNLGWGEYSDAIAINTLIPTKQTMGSGGPVDDGKGDSSSSAAASISIIIGAVVAVLLCLIIVLSMIILMSRRGFIFSSRRSKMMAEKQAADCSGMLPYSNNLCNTMPYSARAPFGLAYQLTQQQQHQQPLRSYVDPHTYEDPCQAVQEFAKEIDANWITIECVLGGGEFGDVCKGLLTVPGRLSQPVAVKTLKPGASDKNKLDFLTEASIMGQFDDPNVIYLEGVVTRSHPAMIVTEFMANGSLDTFLRSHDGELSCQQLVGMLRGIASGMRYLSDTGYIHRDLAARNILVSEQLVCKVADFGLSREIPIDPSVAAAAAATDAAVKDGTYTTRGGKIPIRWTAPEAIHFRKFTSATDVWSFGIVMWEVMSFGERPYWNWSNQDVIAAVENGYRLPPPMDCPESVHRMMLDCWKWDRADRPKFGQLVKALDRLLRQPELLMCQQPRPIYEPPSMSMPAQRCGTVAQWLAGMKLDCYADAFHRCGLVSMEQAPRLTVSDLDAIGINDSGHRRRLLHAVESLKMHIYEAAPYSDGYMV